MPHFLALPHWSFFRMSIALSEFWIRLVRSGICDANGCKRIAAAFTKANAGMPPSAAEAVARFLVKRGTLTRYQARCLLENPPRDLRAGGYLIRSGEAPPPLGGWVEASRIRDRRVGMLRLVQSSSDGPELINALKRHQSVSGEALQPLESEIFDASFLVFSALPSGRCLHEMIADGENRPATEVCRLGIEIARGLETLHGNSLIHGQVRADRVWVDEQDRVILLRDPSAAISLADASNAWLDTLESPSLYAAPELQSAGQARSVATDIYSLGCLLFRLATGRFPFDGQTEQEIIEAHRTHTPPELTEAIERGKDGDPLFRVLAFAMGKRPTARFSTAAQLTGALKTTSKLLDQGPPIPADPKQADPKPSRGGRTKLPVPAASAEVGTKPTKSLKRGSLEPAATATRIASADVTTPTASETPRRPSAERPNQPPSEPPPSKPPATETKSAEPSVAGSQSPFGAAAAAAPTDPQVVGPPKQTSGEASRTRAVRRRRKKKSKAPLVLGALSVAVLMLIIGLIAGGPGGAERQERAPRPPLPSVIPPVTRQTPSGPAQPQRQPADAIAGYQVVDDPKSLYVPPHPATSTPAPLAMLPPGPAVIVTTQLANILEDPAGSELIESFAPELSELIQRAATRAKLPIESIRRLSVALHPGSEGWPEVSLVTVLKQPTLEDDLRTRLQVDAAMTADRETIYVGEPADGDAYFWKAAEDGAVSQFAIGSVERMSEVAALGGEAIPLPRSAQSLWSSVSGDSELIVLVTPNFLFADGRQLLQSSAPELIAPLKRLMQPDVAVSLVSIDLFDQDRVYIESKFAPSGGISEALLMQKVVETTDRWVEWADQFILESVADPSWRLLASRLPSMIRFVVGQLRFGISDGAVVANVYLPTQAFSQVTLASLLAMNTPPSSGAAPTVVETQTPLSLEEMLDREMTVSFDQESLEFALEAIVNAFKASLPAESTMPPVRIIGGDLELGGITQNQQVIDFSKTGVPLRRVLTDLVVGANPDKSAQGPADPKQALIWVVADDPANPGQPAILITTRQAAETKSYALPSEFEIKSSSPE